MEYAFARPILLTALLVHMHEPFKVYVFNRCRLSCEAERNIVFRSHRIIHHVLNEENLCHTHTTLHQF